MRDHYLWGRAVHFHRFFYFSQLTFSKRRTDSAFSASDSGSFAIINNAAANPPDTGERVRAGCQLFGATFGATEIRCCRNSLPVPTSNPNPPASEGCLSLLDVISG